MSSRPSIVRFKRVLCGPWTDQLSVIVGPFSSFRLHFFFALHFSRVFFFRLHFLFSLVIFFYRSVPGHVPHVHEPCPLISPPPFAVLPFVLRITFFVFSRLSCITDSWARVQGETKYLEFETVFLQLQLLPRYERPIIVFSPRTLLTPN